MPTYYARGITVNLGVLPLQEAITPKIVLKKGELAKQQCERAEKRLLESEMLQEQRVDFPNDKAGFELNWLGDAPFMQYQAGHGLFRNHDSSMRHVQLTTVNSKNILRSTESESRYADERAPLALSLHIKLSDKSFRSGLSSENKSHLKIDVFFNGQLSSCTLIPTHDITSGAKSMHQVYAGYRTDFLAERPWVLLPPGVDVDGLPQKQGDLATVQDRWNEISTVLLAEADHRGTNSDGDVPPSAAFLKALSTMPMPQQVVNMHDRGGRSFGIIDVVITAGEGRKVTSGTTYLKNPRRLYDPIFPMRADLPVSSREARDEADDDVALQSDGAAKDIDATKLTSLHPVKRRAIRIQPSGSPERFEGHVQTVPRPDISGIVAPIFSPFTSTYLPSASSPHSITQQLSSFAQLDSPSKLNTALPMYELAHGTDATPQLEPPSVLSFHRPMMNTPHFHPTPDRVQLSDPSHGRVSADAFSAMISSSLLPVSTHHPSLNNERLASPTPSLGSDHNPEAPYASSTTARMVYPGPASPGASSTNAPYNMQPYHTGTAPSSIFRDLVRSSEPVPHGLPVLPSSGLFPPLPFAAYPALSQHSHGGSVVRPPVGLFSVTTKPRRSQSPVKKLLQNNSGKFASGQLVSRLLIRGRNGAIVVDHRWRPPQKIKSGRNVDVNSMNIPDTDAQTKTSDEAERKPPGLIKSRSVSSSILGVHGPKAPPIWFENPEEMIREAARRRKSPRKGETSALPATPVSLVSNATIEEVVASNLLTSSSPLTSLTNTPEPQEGLEVLLSGGDDGAISQVDGTSEHDPPKGSLMMKTTASRTKTKLDNVPTLRSRSLSTAQPSPSPESKKRKFHGATLPKQPRSPGRLKTTTNPPLNKGCVIAFAESADKNAAQGLLRQVKGERQGIFSEDYVVFAMRYFIPGN